MHCIQFNSIQGLKLSLQVIMCTAQQKDSRDIHSHDCSLKKAISEEWGKNQYYFVRFYGKWSNNYNSSVWLNPVVNLHECRRYRLSQKFEKILSQSRIKKYCLGKWQLFIAGFSKFQPQMLVTVLLVIGGDLNWCNRSSSSSLYFPTFISLPLSWEFQLKKKWKMALCVPALCWHEGLFFSVILKANYPWRKGEK